ncbi:MAG: protein-export chaperone SecB [Rhodoblastus sp.]
MAESNGIGAGNAAPQINTLAQYAKDLSFENPNAPRSLAPQERAPNISVQVNVNAQQLAETDFEVQLKLEGAAGEGAETLFKFELEYCGVFRLMNIPEEQVHPAIMIECPRILFPFARQIVADAVRNGGFPPLYLDPVDFGALYMQRMAEAQEGQASTPIA